MNGNQRFVVNWQCGCVISEKAVKEVQSDGCHSCAAAVVEMDRVILNPTDEERAVYITKMETERLAKKSARCQESADSSTIESAPTRKRKAINDPSSSSSSSTKTPTLQKDPSKSSAFKALFTTSEAAKRQPQQHWVTHNPLYY